MTGYSRRFIVAFAYVAMVGAGLYAILGPSYGPIMTCDPVTLKRGESQETVMSACGSPRRTIEERGAEAWYPLLGDKREKREETRDDTWIYGDIFDNTRHVNLYFTGGKLRSVQIYGDYK